MNEIDEPDVEGNEDDYTIGIKINSHTAEVPVEWLSNVLSRSNRVMAANQFLAAVDDLTAAGALPERDALGEMMMNDPKKYAAAYYFRVLEQHMVKFLAEAERART